MNAHPRRETLTLRNASLASLLAAVALASPSALAQPAPAKPAPAGASTAGDAKSKEAKPAAGASASAGAAMPASHGQAGAAGGKDKPADKGAPAAAATGKDKPADKGAPAPATQPAGQAGAAAPSSAEQAALDAARALFAQGLKLEEAGDWVGARDRFQGAGSIRMSSRVRFHIALCNEKLGNLVEAIEGFDLALAEAQKEGAQEVIDPAKRHLEDLRRDVPRLKINLASRPADLSITLDGRPLDPSKLGAEMLVNPGPHKVDAFVPGRPPTSGEFTAMKGRTHILDVEPPAPESADVAEAPMEEPQGDSYRTAGLIAGGFGVASLIGSGVFYGLRSSKLDDAKELCNDELEGCPATAKQPYERGQTYNLVGNVMLGVGIAGITTGVALLVISRDRETEEARVAPKGRFVATAPGADIAGISYWRSF